MAGQGINQGINKVKIYEVSSIAGRFRRCGLVFPPAPQSRTVKETDVTDEQLDRILGEPALICEDVTDKAKAAASVGDTKKDDTDYLKKFPQLARQTIKALKQMRTTLVAQVKSMGKDPSPYTGDTKRDIIADIVALHKMANPGTGS